MNRMYNLYANIKIGDKEEKLLVFQTDLLSMQLYFSYCTEYNHFINTIKRTNSRKNISDNIVYDQTSLKVANFILHEIPESSLEIEDNIPVFYNNDRDIVLANYKDVINIINGLEDDNVINSITHFLKNQLSVYDQEKSLLELVNMAYQNYRTWISFTSYLKNITNKRLIEVTPGKSLEDEYRKRIDALTYYEDHISIYNQIIDNLLPIIGLKEEKERLEEANKSKNNKKVISLRRETETEKYNRMLRIKEFEESLTEEDDDYEDDFLGPTKPNDPRYQLIN